MYRKFFGTLSLVLVLAVAFSVFSPAAAQSGNGGGLSKHDRALLAEAIANGESTVTLLIASTQGSNNRVADGHIGIIIRCTSTRRGLRNNSHNTFSALSTVRPRVF